MLDRHLVIAAMWRQPMLEYCEVTLGQPLKKPSDGMKALRH